MEDPVVGLFYNVELSNGKSFKAVRCNVVDNANNPDISYIGFSIIETTYEQVKELLTGEVNSITVKHCRPTSPPEYTSAPDIIKEEVYEKYGANPSIEPYYDLGFNIKFFKITDDLLLQNKQFEELSKATSSIVSLYENLK